MPHWRRKGRHGLAPTTWRSPYLNRDHPVHRLSDRAAGALAFSAVVALLAALVFWGLFYLREILTVFVWIADALGG